jgi:hypothetical protein
MMGYQALKEANRQANKELYWPAARVKPEKRSPEMRRAIWLKGKKKIAGCWSYNWASDSFYILLDSIDRITGQQREVRVSGDKPEWNGWELVEE